MLEKLGLASHVQVSQVAHSLLTGQFDPRMERRDGGGCRLVADADRYAAPAPTMLTGFQATR